MYMYNLDIILNNYLFVDTQTRTCLMTYPVLNVCVNYFFSFENVTSVKIQMEHVVREKNMLIRNYSYSHVFVSTLFNL